MKATSGAVLAIESATNTGSAAVGREGALVAEVVSNLRSRHSATLLPSVDLALRNAESSRDELDAVVVGAGPGSFTGVRIAAATAKGIAHALEIPLFAYSTLLCQAAPWLETGRTVLSLIDARHRQVYAAAYRLDEVLESPLPDASLDLDEVIERCAGLGSVIVCGDAVRRHRAEIADRLDAVFPAAMFTSPRASSLLWLQQRFPELGVVESAAEWEPDYHRASGAERIRAESTAAAAEG